MKGHVKYARARDQLYHYIVKVRQMHADIPAAHRTTELIQVLEMVELIAEQAKEAFEAGQLLALQLDRYELVELPGFSDFFGETENPYAPRKD